MSILVATPCYGNMMDEPCSHSFALMRKEFAAAGIEHDFLTIGNESLITRARDVCAASFLFETKFSCLLFHDSDIQSEPADVAKLWNLCYEGADVAVGLYRKKKPGSTLSAWVGGKNIDESAWESDQPFEVDFAGTGFMMIRRQTFNKLQNLHPEWEYEEGMPEEFEQREDDIKSGRCFAFFQDPIANVEGKGRFKLSEDYFFCLSVRAAGMKVIADPTIKLKHWGKYPY